VCEFKSLDFLLERRKLYSDAAWESLYQQSPYLAGGGVIPIDKLRVVPTMFDRNKIQASVRYFDRAGTADSETAAYTAD